MKSGIIEWISRAVLLGLFAVTAQAFAANSRFEEVPQAQADRIAPLGPDFWASYRNAGKALNHPQDLVIGAELGVVILDSLVNLGKAIWDIIEKGRPTLDISTDVASAVPQGIKDWTQLQDWKDPISKLYKAQLLVSENDSLGDVYFRLVFAYGGNYQGQGQYLANVTVIPALVSVPYARNFYAKTQVEQLLNEGSAGQPVAGMSLLLLWGVSELVGGNTEQSIELHVRGDGGVDALPGPTDSAQTIDAPVTRIRR